MNKSYVILVDTDDQVLGSMEKMEAHRDGVLHRAFSVFIFNRKGEMLLQQRADGKYHSAGLWANACCSHPFPGETTSDAAHRRLMEELGFDTPLQKIFDFTYRITFPNGLTENEFDHVYTGEYNGPVVFNTDEVQAVKYVEIPRIREMLSDHPGQFTAWFAIAFPRVMEWWKKAEGQQI